ncbi:MAG TPA: glycoside hydrolase family 1 protein [Bellilinea sp.]|nr:glycoside hydrolase family 1 protein [Bellilinea sp.]
MLQATYHFPKGFLWGAATASHQVEGSNTNNNWSAWEEQAGRIRLGHTAGLACDWWGGRWKEDFDRAAETGQNAHRMSIEWSRVQPRQGVWDESAIDYYRQMLRGLDQRSLTPMVTLHHFTDPLWLTEIGGWENDETPALFEKFVAKMVDALKEFCRTWITINEPNVYTVMGYIFGAFPPGKNDLKSCFPVLKNMIRGHAAAYRAIHSLQPDASVGIALNYQSFQPAHPWLPLDHWLARFVHNNFNAAFPQALASGKFKFAFQSISLPEARNTQDFFGLNYYTRQMAAVNLFRKKDLFIHLSYPKDAEISDTGHMANVPQGFYEAMKFAKGFGIPIYITENGVEDADDNLRPRYLIQHIHQMWRAVNFNWPIKGYFHWSLVDNFEWERGWTQRFGLWGLDLETQARTRRTSVDVYEAICRENGIDSTMVWKYTQTIFNELFPS